MEKRTSEMIYEETGILGLTELQHIYPSGSRLEKGPVAIIECLQEIPCDPCVEACKLSAIKKSSFSDPPKIDHDACIGCGKCIELCPGLAIFVLELNHNQHESLIIIPYERLPKPNKDEIFEALDRSGVLLGEAKIVSVRETTNHTQIVSFLVDKKIALHSREIGRRIR